MTEHEAIEFVRSTFDDDEPDETLLAAAFSAIYGREPDETDEEVGLWSLLAASVTGLCGCSTRRQHEAGGCAEAVDEIDGSIYEPESEEGE